MNRWIGTLYLACVLGSATPSRSQVALDPPTQIPASATVSPPLRPRPRPTPPIPSPGTVALSYMDTSTVTYLWRVPANYPDFQMLLTGERFTLPTEWGRLDSVAIFLKELPLGQIRLDVYTDTLRQRRMSVPTLFHYPTIFFPENKPIDTSIVVSTDLDTTRYTVARFNGKWVPREFHVLVSPMTAGGISSLYGVITDAKPGDENSITPENARSMFLANVGGTILPIHFYGFFAPAGVSIAPDLYMIAYVTVDPVDAVRDPGISPGAMDVEPYPNPVRTSNDPWLDVRFSTPDAGTVRLQMFDLLGRLVRTGAPDFVPRGTHRRRIGVDGLAPGAYLLRVSGAGGQASRLVSVAP
jgi:hypothetical protein